MRPDTVELGHAEREGRLRVSEPLSDHEDDRFAEHRLELRQFTRQPASAVEIAPIGRMLKSGDDREMPSQPCQRRASAMVIMAGISDYTDKPCRELGFAFEAADLLHQRATDLLGNVLRIGARSGQPPCKTVHQVVVPPQQGLERRSIAEGGAIDKILIAIAGDLGVCANRCRVRTFDRVQRCRGAIDFHGLVFPDARRRFHARRRTMISGDPVNIGAALTFVQKPHAHRPILLTL